MNTGAEAVETAIKVGRRWGYEVKGVPDGQAPIIVCDGNFHGRTTTIVGFSSDPAAAAASGRSRPASTGALRRPRCRRAGDRRDRPWPCWSSPCRARPA